MAKNKKQVENDFLTLQEVEKYRVLIEGCKNKKHEPEIYIGELTTRFITDFSENKISAEDALLISKEIYKIYNINTLYFENIEQTVDIKVPPQNILEAWVKDVNNCMEINVSTELMLQAYYFDCAFMIGRMDEPKEDIEISFYDKNGEFCKDLSTCTREGLIDAICYITLGMRAPTYGHSKEFKDEFEKRLKKSTIYVAE